MTLPKSIDGHRGKVKTHEPNTGLGAFAELAGTVSRPNPRLDTR